jgi:hypothetical protein
MRVRTRLQASGQLRAVRALCALPCMQAVCPSTHSCSQRGSQHEVLKGTAALLGVGVLSNPVELCARTRILHACSMCVLP